MPRIEIRDGSIGLCYTISSSNPDTISAWLWETLQRCLDTHIYPASITAHPLRLSDNQPDWPVDMSKRFDVQLSGSSPTDHVHELIKALQKFAVDNAISHG